MRSIVLWESVTLDGVRLAPGRPDEDTRGGFTHGGWGTRFADPALGAAATASMAGTGAILLGRRTYEDFFAVWPARTGDPYSRILNEAPKYVASRTLREPLPWQHSILLEGDAADAVARLRAEDGPDIVLLGSGELARWLIARGLVDRFVLLITPIVLGCGTRLFEHGLPVTDLRLVDTTTTTTGVIVATYVPAAV